MRELIFRYLTKIIQQKNRADCERLEIRRRHGGRPFRPFSLAHTPLDNRSGDQRSQTPPSRPSPHRLTAPPRKPKNAPENPPKKTVRAPPVSDKSRTRHGATWECSPTLVLVGPRLKATAGYASPVPPSRPFTVTITKLVTVLPLLYSSPLSLLPHFTNSFSSHLPIPHRGAQCSTNPSPPSP